MSSLRVEVDRDVCVGAGMCVLNAPNVFDQGTDDGLVVLRQPEPAESEARNVREAAHVCPSGAITLT